MVEPSKELQLVFDKAISDAKSLQHEYVTLEHIMFAMLCSENFYNIVQGYGADSATPCSRATGRWPRRVRGTASAATATRSIAERRRPGSREATSAAVLARSARR